MAVDFSQVLSKFNWSNRHMAALHFAVSDYIDLDPFVTAVEDQPEAQAYSVTLKLRCSPPTTISHVIGDVLNSLHGTLDYLAYQLALREGETPDLETSFPIIKPSKDGTAEQRVNIYRRGDDGRGRVPMIKDPKVLAFLREVQPYQCGDRWANHPLHILRTLNGKIKHRYPALLVTATPVSAFVYTTKAEPVISANLGGPFEDGDQIALVPYTEQPEFAAPEHAKFQTVVSLEGAPSAAEPVLKTLGDIGAYVYDTVLMGGMPAIFS
jgi:hypothetical protein